MSKRALIMHPYDNVATALEEIRAGEEVTIPLVGTALTLRAFEAIPFGFDYEPAFDGFAADLGSGFASGLASDLVFASASAPPEMSKPMMNDTSLRTPSAGRSEMKA